MKKEYLVFWLMLVTGAFVGFYTGALFRFHQIEAKVDALTVEVTEPQEAPDPPEWTFNAQTGECGQPELKVKVKSGAKSPTIGSSLQRPTWSPREVRMGSREDLYIKPDIYLIYPDRGAPKAEYVPIAMPGGDGNYHIVYVPPTVAEKWNNREEK